jgi:LuxR family transcriptional regulator, maltose regulon positive regulatory protein
MVVLQSKFLIPAFTRDRLERPRLVQLVQRHLEGGAALVVAPPGYGKTTLAAEVADAFGERVVWLQLDGGDDDPTAFVIALLHGVARTFPGLRAELEALIEPGATLGAERMATMLVNVVLTALPEPWLLVLDDLHLVTNPRVHALVARWVELAPPGVRTLMASRAQPPLPLARWRSRGVLGDVEADDLRFTSAEAAAWLRRETPGLSADAVERLVDRTEGWGAGLRLATRLLAGTAADDDAEALSERLSGGHPSVASYLMDEVFARQPEDVQAFMLRTAVLPRMDAAMCRDVLAPERPTSLQDAQAMLERLERDQTFVQRLGDDARWFRYHHLFHEFLRQRLGRQGPPVVNRLQRRAARGCEARGELELATSFYLAAGDHADAARTLERFGPELLRRGLVDALHRLLVPLDGELDAWPHLRLLHGRALYQRGHLGEAIRALSRARRSAAARGDGDVACEALTHLAAIARSQGDYVGARLHAVEATEGAAAAPATLAAALMERAKSEGMLSGMVRGRALAERALETVEAAPDLVPTHLHAAVLRSSAQIAWWHGDVDAAVRHGRAALKLLDDDDPLAADVRLTLATPTLYRHDASLAIELAEAALMRFQRFQLRERLPAAYAVLGNALTRAGELEQAERCLRRAIDIASEIGGASFDHVMAAGYLAHNLSLRDRAAEAIGVAEAALWPHDGAPVTYEIYVCRSVLADAFLSTGREAEAERIYLDLAAIGEARQYRVPLALVHFGLAYLLLRAGDRDAGRERAQRALAMLAPTRAWQLWADQGARAAVVIEALTPEQADHAFVARVRAALGPAARSTAPSVVEPRLLELDVLGGFRARVAGRPLPPSAWVSSKARDLLAYLATVRGEPVSADRALEALWPDQPGRARTAFHTALYRLRGALRGAYPGADTVVLVEGRSYRLDEARVAVDVERFDALVREARRAPAARASELLGQAVALVRGEYLAGLDYPWLAAERRRVGEAHASALSSLTDAQLAAGAFDAALELAQQQLELDPLREAAHVQAMRARHALGDRAGVERQWQALRDTLRDELGVEPLDDTRRVYERLRSDGA